MLHILQDVYIGPLRMAALRPGRFRQRTFTQEDIDEIFGNVEHLTLFHEKFLYDLELR